MLCSKVFRFAALLTFFALAGCAEQEAQAPEQDAITGGMLESGEDAVGLVKTKGGYCSGILIAPRVVLTAAHCVLPKQSMVMSGTLGGGEPRDAIPRAIVGFYRGPGNKERDLSKMIEHQAAKAVLHPSWSPDEEVSHDFDVALIQLVAPAAGVTPAKVAAKSATPVVGRACKTVGYGLSDKGFLGQKQSATMKVHSLTSHAMVVSAVTGLVDHGDSGGPFLCNAQVVGVTSNDHGEALKSAEIQRTDVVAAWIAEQTALLSK